jgi:hypothetical protein
LAFYAPASNGAASPSAFIAKLLEKTRRRQEQAHADSLFVIGMEYRAPCNERDYALLIINAFCAVDCAYEKLVKVLSSRP